MMTPTNKFDKCMKKKCGKQKGSERSKDNDIINY